MDDRFDRTRGLTVLCALAVFQGLFRIAIALAIMSGSMVDEGIGLSEMALNGVLAMFLFLGVMGIVAAAGIWMGRRWGIDWTIGLSAITIVFDLWAVLTVQPSAAMGLLLPAVFIICLFPMRGHLRRYICDEGLGRVRD